MLAARGVGKRLGYRRVLRNIDLTLAPGGITAVFGPNGAGKSTLLQVLATLTSPSEGSVTWKGVTLDKSAREYRRELGVVAHATYLYRHLSAAENLRFYGRLYGVTGLEERITEVLDQVDLAGAAREPVMSFSRGMKQRLAIARAVLHRPRVLLLDEPFTGLDRQGQALFKGLLDDFRAGGGACLMISHDFSEAVGLADEYVILSRGSVAATGEGTDLSSAEMARIYEESTRA